MISTNIQVAILIGVLASCSTVVGMNIQKYALTDSSPIKGKMNRTCTWLVGMCFVALATAGDMIALTLAPQSIVAPLGSLSIVMNAFIAPRIIGETLNKHVFAGSICTMAGCILATASAPREGVQTTEELMRFYASKWSLAYSLIIVGLVASGVNVVSHANVLLRDFGEDSIQYARMFRMHRMAHPIVAGISGAQTVTLVRTVVRPDVDEHLRAMLAIFLLAAVIYQLYTLNAGLAQFESLQIVPVYTATWIIFTILGGGIVYDEFKLFSYGHFLFFIFAVGMCCGGVLILSSSEKKEETKEIAITHQNLGDSENAAFPV